MPSIGLSILRENGQRDEATVSSAADALTTVGVGQLSKEATATITVDLVTARHLLYALWNVEERAKLGLPDEASATSDAVPVEP